MNQQGEAASYYTGSFEQDTHQELQSAAHVAANSSGENRDIFESAISKIMSNVSGQPVANHQDIQAAQEAHQHVMNNGSEAATPEQIGNAAAVEALQKNESSGGGLSSLIGTAMSMASKFSGKSNNSGGSGGSSNENAVQQAAMMALKLYMAKQSGSNGQSQSQSSGVSSLITKLLLGSSSNNNNQQQQQQQQQQQHTFP
ncbi:hypothetical protein K501DRAFT_275754 [Backusella circina FSU 941]|nr:hypothetical protein K501DRAFT_275754 [Backusella circina FSU 941]